MKYLPSPSAAALRQCEILSDLYLYTLAPESFAPGSNPPLVLPIHHPFVIILSQDCDLELDYMARTQSSPVGEDKLLPSVLFCEMTTAESLAGRNNMNSTIWQKIRQNKDERYQFLEKVPAEQDAIHKGLPELGIDFKRYFTVPTAEVYARLQSQTKRRSIMYSPYLEHVSTRFCYFQMRIALPQDHKSE